LNAKHLLFNAVALLVYTGSGKETETADVRAALERLMSVRALLRAIVQIASSCLRLQCSVKEQVHTKNGYRFVTSALTKFSITASAQRPNAVTGWG
jgi:hypothetical protein